ncbi:MAG TPA: tetratricopeptide repeat protein, partial [Kofleriaceae bacterium]|nr:tetratricopeptide repeat protein [Kofleriaceae bacterium]
MSEPVDEAVAATLRRASELIATGQWHYAVEVLEGELERNPDDVCLLVSIARTYRDVKRHQDALRLLAMARAFAPDDREVLLRLGIVYREAADLSGALNAHERLVALYPADGEASRQYALTLVA